MNVERPWLWRMTTTGGVRPATEEEQGMVRLLEDFVLAQDITPGYVMVSTVLCHGDCSMNPCPNAAPLVFETMVFGSMEQVAPERFYYTLEEAMAGHAEWCRQYLRREPDGFSVWPRESH